MSRQQGIALILVLVVVPALIYAWMSALRGDAQPSESDSLSPTPGWIHERFDEMDAHLEAITKGFHIHEPEPAPPPPQPHIERADVNGQDLADLLGISIWKFRFLLSEGTYTAHLWIEHWTRDADVPKIHHLLTGAGKWGQGDLTVKLPMENDTRLFLRLGDSIGQSNPDAEPLDIHNPIGFAVLQRSTLNANQPVTLLSLTHNDSGPARAILQGAHEQNDQAIYLKIVFVPGDDAQFDPTQWVEK